MLIYLMQCSDGNPRMLKDTSTYVKGRYVPASDLGGCRAICDRMVREACHLISRFVSQGVSMVLFKIGKS